MDSPHVYLRHQIKVFESQAAWNISPAQLADATGAACHISVRYSSLSHLITAHSSADRQHALPSKPTKILKNWKIGGNFQISVTSIDVGRRSYFPVGYEKTSAYFRYQCVQRWYLRTTLTPRVWVKRWIWRIRKTHQFTFARLPPNKIRLPSRPLRNWWMASNSTNLSTAEAEIKDPQILDPPPTTTS